MRRRRAVDGLDLAVADGEFVTLLGPSGCGKSTALACIAGLERPSEGTIVFDRRDVTDFEPRERNIAMVFQDYALYPHMSARENMSFGLQPAADRSGHHLAARSRPRPRCWGSGISSSGGRPSSAAASASGSRSAVRSSAIPPSADGRAALQPRRRPAGPHADEIKRLQRELGITAIFVTHDQEEAMVLSDRVAVMPSGELQQIGPPWKSTAVRPTSSSPNSSAAPP